MPELTIMRTSEQVRDKQMDTARLRLYSRCGTLSNMISLYLEKDHEKDCPMFGRCPTKRRGIMYIIHKRMGAMHCFSCTRAIERAFFLKGKNDRKVGSEIVEMAKSVRISKEELVWSVTNMHTYSVYYKHGVVGPGECALSDRQTVALRDSLNRMKSGTRTLCGRKVEMLTDEMFLEDMQAKNKKRWSGWAQRERFCRPLGKIVEENNEMIKAFKRLRKEREPDIR